jgi:hypothetical protein
MTSAGSRRAESPLACDLAAISVSDRPRYGELRRMVAAAITGKRELPNGIAAQIATERMALEQLAEWIVFERKCCPLFEFRIDIAPKSGPVWLSLTGPAGVKEFLVQAFAETAISPN